MPTPMRVFAQIASEYGVDPNDNEAVDLFFESDIHKLPADERQRLLDRLFEADGQSDE